LIVNTDKHGATGGQQKNPDSSYVYIIAVLSHQCLI